ncbi:retrotransposon protein, putative, ty1-copia subclass [Tanacetum coccineum]
MSTRSNYSNLFSPLRDPESLIRRRNLGEPLSLFYFEGVMSIPHNNMGPPPAGPPPPNNNGPPPVVRPNGQAPRSMEELCQPSIDGRGGPIAPISVQATDFGNRHHMIQQVQNTCQFHGLPGDDANRHIYKFLEITQHMKQNGVSDDALRLSLFPYSLTHHAIAWYDRLPRNSIHSFEDMMRNFLSKYFPLSMMTKLRNEITKFEQKPHESLFEAWERYKLSIDRFPNHNMLLVTQIITILHGSLPSNTVANPRGEVKAITTRSGVAYNKPTILPTPSPLLKELERETEVTKDKKPEVASKSLNPKHVNKPYPSRLNDQKLREKANNQMLKFLQIFQRLHFDISFTDALLHMPKFDYMFKSLLSNKEKLFELANTPLNENCSAVLLKNRFDDNNVISVSKNNLVYFMAVPRDGIFEIDMSCSNTNDSSMYAITNKRAKINLDSSLLWHCRLGHISKKRIEKLQHDGLLNSIDIESLGKCVSCLSGKMARKPYSHQVERAKDLLGLIHTDVCGPFRIVSRQGASYFVTFTDDFSRYGYVYLLKHKHEVFETFKVFQKEVENQLGKTIKSLRSDRGGEYMSQEFLDHLKEHGIIAHRTPPYTPQNNGVSKRRNRTLLDMGCEALVKRDTLTKPDKLDPRSFRCIFVGYLKKTIGYYFFNPSENKVFIARNAKFFENDLIDLKASGSVEDLELIQEEDTNPSVDTSLNHEEDDQEID